jgi:hypothetical protein
VNQPLDGSEFGEPVYGVGLTSIPNARDTLGASFGYHADPALPMAVASVGNGLMWVVDDGRGDIEPGDYLIASDFPGAAMQDDPNRFPVGHIVAQAGQPVAWDDVPADSGGVKRALIHVQFERFDRHGSPAMAQRLSALLEKVNSQELEIQQLEALLLELSETPAADSTSP